jgi:hypothetical protein
MESGARQSRQIAVAVASIACKPNRVLKARLKVSGNFGGAELSTLRSGSATEDGLLRPSFSRFHAPNQKERMGGAAAPPYRVVKRWLASVGAWLALSAAVAAATLSSPAVDAYNVRAGTETFGGLYKFTTNTLLVETAEAITNMGSDIIKFYLGSDTSLQSGVDLPPNVTNLMTLARDCPSYHQVLDMPFRHFILWAYPFANADSWWANGYNAAQGAKDYQEMYNLTCYLLTNYNNTGKTFYLGHWEGDGYLSVPVNGVGWATNPPALTIQGMIGWLNNRQQAVDDAKNNTPHTNVYVYNYAEANRVRDAMLNGPNNNQRVINMVVPSVTNLDYLSYSSYDAENLDAADLYATLNYMESHLPPAKSGLVPGERMWVGEYGWGGNTPAAQEPLSRSYIQRLLNWQGANGALQFILFWEIYNNQASNGTNYYLISPTDAPAPCYYLLQRFLNHARLLVAQFNETNGSLPNDAQFSALTAPLLNSPLPPPVNLTVANLGASFVTPSNAAVTGSLAQGVYGDDEAALWLFWGPQDGGTNVRAWANSRLIEVNTNFNPRSYAVPLSNLLPQTNYYYRFYATNSTTNAWAPSSARFSTLTLSAAPNLQTNSVPNGVVLTWPGSGVGFALYSTTNLSPPALWLPVTNQPILISNQWQVDLATNSDTARFYRLQSR